MKPPENDRIVLTSSPSPSIQRNDDHPSNAFILSKLDSEKEWMYTLVEQVDWEDAIIWGDKLEFSEVQNGTETKLMASSALTKNQSLFALPNKALENGDWVDDIIWDPDHVCY